MVRRSYAGSEWSKKNGSGEQELRDQRVHRAIRSAQSDPFVYSTQCQLSGPPERMQRLDVSLVKLWKRRCRRRRSCCFGGHRESERDGPHLQERRRKNNNQKLRSPSRRKKRQRRKEILNRLFDSRPDFLAMDSFKLATSPSPTCSTRLNIFVGLLRLRLGARGAGPT